MVIQRERERERETLVNLILFVFWGDGGRNRSADRSSQWKPNRRVSALTPGAVDSWAKRFVWRAGFCGTVDFLLHKRTPRRVGRDGRSFTLGFLPPALLLLLLLLRWVGGVFLPGETTCRLCPLNSSSILASSRPSFRLSIHPSLLQTGPPSDWVSESRVPLKVSLLLHLPVSLGYVLYQVGHTVRAGRWVGWRTIHIYHPAGGFSVCYFRL